MLLCCCPTLEELLLLLVTNQPLGSAPLAASKLLIFITINDHQGFSFMFVDSDSESKSERRARGDRVELAGRCERVASTCSASAAPRVIMMTTTIIMMMMIIIIIPKPQPHYKSHYKSQAACIWLGSPAKRAKGCPIREAPQSVLGRLSHLASVVNFVAPSHHLDAANVTPRIR